MEHLSPAAYVIRVFGGIRPTAKALGRDPTCVARWAKPHSARGTDGYLPRLVQIKILEVARARGLDITALDLLYGRRIVALPADEISDRAEVA